MAKDKRFDYQKVQGSTYIIVDKQTGVNYLLCMGGGGAAGGLTPLLDSDGKVVVTPVYSTEK